MSLKLTGSAKQSPRNFSADQIRPHSVTKFKNETIQHFDCFVSIFRRKIDIPMRHASFEVTKKFRGDSDARQQAASARNRGESQSA